MSMDIWLIQPYIHTVSTIERTKDDITYNEDGHVNSEDSPTVRVKEEIPPQKEDNTIAKDPIPQTGNNSFIALIVIAGTAIVLAIISIRLKKHSNK